MTLSTPAQEAAKPEAAAAAPNDKAGVPKLQFAHTSHDFGRVQPTDVLKHEFILTNVGNATLEITDVHPGCGCTTAGTWDRVVEPGKTGVIPIQLNPLSFSGPVSKSITVNTSDPAQRTALLEVKASVWRAVEVAPTSAYFTVTEDQQTNETRIVRILNNEEEPLRLSEPKSSSPIFKATVKEVKPGKEFEVHVALTPPVTELSSRGTVTVETSSKKVPMVSIGAFAMMQPALSVSPSQIFLQAGPQASNRPHLVTIRVNSTNQVEISEPAINVEGANVKVNPIQVGRLFNVQVSFPDGFQLKPEQKVELSLKSTHPKFRVIKVPVMQFPPPAAPIKAPVSAASSAAPAAPVAAPR